MMRSLTAPGLRVSNVIRNTVAGLVFMMLMSCGSDNPSDSGSQVSEPTAPARPPISADADLIVIGSGLSGLSAALEASSLGRSVIVIDMASVFGGHAVMSAGGMAIVDTPMQREMGITDSIEIAYSDFVTWGEDVNEAWVRYYVDNSREMIYDWATELGVTFNVILGPPGNSVPRMHFPVGLGLGLIAPLMREAAARPNIEFRWNSKADSLILQDNRVVGVKITNTRSGSTSEIHGHAVAVATGGYQSNLERVRENWRSDLPAPDTLLAGSGWNSQGSGLDLATGAGAALEHLDYTWNYVTGVPDPRYDSEERGLRFFIEGRAPGTDIWINDDGERFTNECLSPKYALGTVLEQPGKSHWMVFDTKLQPHVSVAGTGWTPDKVDELILRNTDIMKSGEDLGELALQINVDPQVLQATVDRFNSLVDTGRDADYRRFGDDPDPRTGDCGPVSKLDQPPYFAVKRYPLTRKSMGGIKIGPGARVLDDRGDVVPGLYAAGEATGLAGINGIAGLEGTFLGPSLVTGRVLGRTVAQDLAGVPVVAVSRDSVQPGTSTGADAGDEDCTACHNIPVLSAASRPGYEHFERAHGLVLERDLACSDCHTGMLPFEAMNHRVSMLSLAETCVHCHGSGGD